MHVDRDEIRIGLLLESRSIAAWCADAIDRLSEVEGVRLCVAAVMVDRPNGPAGRPYRNSGTWSWTMFDRLTSRNSAALRRVELSEHIAGVPVLAVPRGRAATSETVSGSDLQDLEAHEPDVILHLGSEPLGGALLDAFPLGIWSFHHDGDRIHDRAPPYFREPFDHMAVTRVTLRRHNRETATGEVLADAFFPTIPHSYGRNRDQALTGATELPAQVCRRILAGDCLDHVQGPGEPTAPRAEAPDGRELARHLPRLVTAWVRWQADGLTKSDRWHVGVVHRGIETLLEDPAIDHVHWLDRPRGADRYVADPFACPSSHGTVVLVEDFDHRTRHGTIAAYRLEHDDRSGQPVSIASFPVHASYPFLVEVDGDWWCIPEMAGANEVRAFRFDPDSLKLEDLGPLLTGVSLVDPTMFRWRGHWWLFGTDANRGTNTHLRAWWSEKPTGPWHQHAIDPLCIDVRGARGAGTPFVHDDVLYRPAQDCSRSYGGSTVIKRVRTLNPRAFDEEVAVRIRPDPHGSYPDGLHTVARMGDSVLVDGTSRRFSKASFAHEFLARAKRLRGSPSSAKPVAKRSGM